MSIDSATVARIVAEHERIVESNPAMQHEWHIHSVGNRLRVDMTESERTGLLDNLDVPLSEPAQGKRIRLATARLAEALANLDACEKARRKALSLSPDEHQDESGKG